MYAPVSVRTLYEQFKTALALKWQAGIEQQQQPIRPEPADAFSTIGYLNLVHPQQITIIGAQEFSYLAKLDVPAYNDAINQLAKQQPVLIIITDAQQPTPEMIDMAKLQQIPMLSSESSGALVLDHLNHYLMTCLANTVTVHGVFMEVFDLGVLLTGHSGIGKSELALELINRGHKLVADDSPSFCKLTPNALTGSCPPLLQNFLEVRGLGIINIKEMFGSTAIKGKKQLHLIIQLLQLNEIKLTQNQRLEGIQTQRVINHVSIPEVTIPVAPGRNLAILIEAAVRNQILKENGYQAAKRIDELLTNSIQSQNNPI